MPSQVFDDSRRILLCFLLFVVLVQSCVMMFLLILESRTLVKLTRTLMCYAISCFAVADNHVLEIVQLAAIDFISSHKDHTVVPKNIVILMEHCIDGCISHLLLSSLRHPTLQWL